MNQIKNLHRESMDWADRADLSRRQGDAQRAAEQLRRAFELEQQAADLARSDRSLEPTRSVLHRSAASLALECGAHRDAERLIAAALAGDPPEEIANELRDLLEQVYFERHLALRGVTLDPDTVQLTIAGQTVGGGMAPTEEFLSRVQTFERLVYRTAERKLGLEYRENGAAEATVRKRFQVFVSVPRAASVAVSLRIGRTEQQGMFPEWETPLDAEAIVDDIAFGLESLDAGNESAIKERIPDESYYRNFVGLARKLAPDGRDVRLVGLTIMRGTRARQVALTRPRRELGPVRPRPAGLIEGAIPAAVRGTLLYADATGGHNGRIKVVDTQGDEHLVVVPEGMMADIVRPLWDQVVIVEGTRTREGIRLEDIRRADV